MSTQQPISGLGLASPRPPACGSRPSTAATRPHRRLRLTAVVSEIALTLAAVLGVAVAGATVVAVRSGYEPLVVRSGSMEPTIATGSMVLVKEIDASEIRAGDILAVERPDHTRVTHRVVSVELRGDVAELVMKGDANEDPDPVPVTVRRAGRVAWQVPAVGRAAAWLATAQGGFVLGCIATIFFLHALRRRGGHPLGRRRRATRAQGGGRA